MHACTSLIRYPKLGHPVVASPKGKAKIWCETIGGAQQLRTKTILATANTEPGQ